MTSEFLLRKYFEGGDQNIDSSSYERAVYEALKGCNATSSYIA